MSNNSAIYAGIFQSNGKADAMSDNPGPGGRPSPYKPEYAQQAANYCELGATDEEIARYLGVSVRTVYRWKAEHSEFCQALRVGKAAADDRVKRALYAKASGGVRVEQVAHVLMDKDGNERVEVVENEIVVPGDTSAMIFWLKNRDPEHWRDRKELEHSGTGGGPVRFINEFEDEPE